MGRPPYLRVCYLATGFAFIPDPELDDPTHLRRVNDAIVLYPCFRCKAKRGELCTRDNGEPMPAGHYRGSGKGKHMPYAKRLEVMTELITLGVYDRVEMLESRATLRTSSADFDE